MEKGIVMERKWSARAYREGDEEGILELWKAVYPERKYDQEHWLKWWRWMYKENPAGAGKIWVAEHNGKTVGQYAVIPVVAKLGTESVIISQSVDTITHPHYRRQGIFETLAKEVYREAQGNDINIVFGFPAENSRPGFIKKLDWFDVIKMPLIFKPFNWGNSLKLRLRNRLLLEIGPICGKLLQKLFYKAGKPPVVEGLTISQVSRFDERINEFWDRVSSQYPIMVVRNKDYLNWRYVAVPDIDYTIYIAEKEGEINGYLVLRCMQRQHIKVGIIFDILARTGDIAQCLILKGMEHCKRENVDLIYSDMIANKTLVKAFRRNGFMFMPFVKGSWFMAYSSSQDISKEFLMDAKNWFVQVGDSDML